MPANTKWPDFQLASKLRHFMGTQSSVPEGAPTDKPSSSATLFGGPQPQQRGDEEYIDDSQEPAFHSGQSAAMASGHDQHEQHLQHDHQMDAEDDLDALSHTEGGVDLDATDYGDLEMFDSNASQVFYPEPADMTQPELQPTPDAPGASKRDKRKKKDKSSKGKAAVPAAAPEDEGVEAAELEPTSPSKKRKRSKRKSLRDAELIDSQLTSQVEEAVTAQAQPGAGDDGLASVTQSLEPLTAASSQLTRKRGPADSAEGKQRKKRRSKAHAGEEVILGTQEEEDLAVKADPLAAHATFLLSRGVNNSVEVLPGSIEEGGEHDPASQGSPSAARARRRSQSIGLPHSREASVPFRAAVAPMAPMAIDAASRAQEVDSMDFESANEQLQAEKAGADVESLAREAWREHVSTQQDEEDSSSASENEDASEGQGNSRRRNVRGKKSKAAAAAAPEASAEAESSATAAAAAAAAAAVAPDSVIDPNLSTKPPPQKKTRGKIAVKSSKGKPPVQDKKQSGTRQKPKEEQEEEEDDEEDGGKPPAGHASQYKANGFLQGRFSDEELAKITRAVESFREESGLTQYQMNEMIHAPGGTAAGTSHAELWLRLTAQCPDRKRQKVINVTRKKFHNFVARGTWTTEQDTELSELIKIHGTSWSKIAAIINRHPEDVRDRYRNYIVCGAAQRKDVWDEAEEARLKHHVKHAMDTIDELRKNSKGDKLLLNNSYEELIDWQGISEKMGRTRSRLQCITKWKLMTKRSKEGKPPKPTPKEEQQPKKRMLKLDAAREQLAAIDEPEQYRLVLAIHKAGPESDAEIPWEKLVDKQYRSKWSRECQLLLWGRLKRSVPEWDRKTMREITQYIINLYNHTGRMPESDSAPDTQHELEMMKQARARVAPATQPKSAEIVEDSGAEEEGAAMHEEAAEATEAPPPLPTDELDLNIDPALSTQIPPSAQPGPAPTPKSAAVKNKKEKQADAEKTPGPKRRSKKAAAAPIEADSSSSKDAEVVAAAADAAAAAAAAAAATTVPEQLVSGTGEAEEASAKESRGGKKGGGGKNKSPAKAKTARARKDAKSAATVPAETVSDSDMDDMEDLPAKVASSATRARK